MIIAQSSLNAVKHEHQINNLEENNSCHEVEDINSSNLTLRNKENNSGLRSVQMITVTITFSQIIKMTTKAMYLAIIFNTTNTATRR